MDLIGGVASGLGGATLDTVWVSWVMVLMYSRFGVLLGINVILLILVIVSLNIEPETKPDIVVSVCYSLSTKIFYQKLLILATANDALHLIFENSIM